MSSLTKLMLNNEIVSMRHNIRRARTQIAHKLTRCAKTLKSKLGTDSQKHKNFEKASRLINEVLELKKWKDDDIASFCLRNHREPSNILADAKVPLKVRPLARIAEHSSVKPIILRFREKYPNWKEQVPVVLNALRNREKLRLDKKEANESVEKTLKIINKLDKECFGKFHNLKRNTWKIESSSENNPDECDEDEVSSENSRTVLEKDESDYEIEDKLNSQFEQNNTSYNNSSDNDSIFSNENASDNESALSDKGASVNKTASSNESASRNENASDNESASGNENASDNDSTFGNENTSDNESILGDEGASVNKNTSDNESALGDEGASVNESASGNENASDNDSTFGNENTSDNESALGDEGASVNKNTSDNESALGDEGASVKNTSDNENASDDSIFGNESTLINKNALNNESASGSENASDNEIASGSESVSDNESASDNTNNTHSDNFFFKNKNINEVNDQLFENDNNGIKFNNSNKIQISNINNDKSEIFDRYEPGKFVKLKRDNPVPVKNIHDDGNTFSILENYSCGDEVTKSKTKSLISKNRSMEINKICNNLNTAQLVKPDPTINQKYVDPFFVKKDNSKYLTYAQIVTDEKPFERKFTGVNRRERRRQMGVDQNFEKYTDNLYQKNRRKDFSLEKKSKYCENSTNKYIGNNKFQSNKSFREYQFKRNETVNNDLNKKHINNKRYNKAETGTNKLHPSWAAKKKQSTLVAFQGKKITFDD